MAEEVKEKKEKKPSKALPALIFLIGLALIVGGALMQAGYFGSSATPTPEESTNAEESVPVDVEEPDVVDETTADASEADFSITDIQDNQAINVKQGIDYTYAGAFAMTVSEFQVTCENDVCGQEGDQVVLKFSTADGKDYPITLTPSAPTANLIDVPVTVQEWHEDYVVVILERQQ